MTELSTDKKNETQDPVEPGGRPAASDGEEISPSPALFANGQWIAERYEVLRFIDRGGVGEVYEVADRELNERVALKVLRQEGASAENLERFKREINLARQVTHPNVCRIYEFGQESRALGRYFFLTMELLSGETLYEHIRQQGPMSTTAALPLVRQMAAGLEAARKAGVIHRDFKSSNVVLVEAPEVSGGVRAVVTDFGLARAAQDDKHHRVTAHDSMLGTPAYMAPEQVEGSEVTAATDIFAVGVVLYEMLTGRYPFEGETALSTALKRLRETPTTPRSHVPQLPLRWQTAILRCLERQPWRRFQTATELVEALEGRRRVYPAAQALRRWLGLGSAVVLLLAVLWLAASRWQMGEPVPAVTEDRSALSGTLQRPSAVPLDQDFELRTSLALLGFRNLSAEPTDAWLATALAELLATEVAVGDHLRIVPGEKVARARHELGMDDAAAFDEGPMDRLATLLGSDLAVTGSYLADGQGDERDIRLDVQIRDVVSGRVLHHLKRRGSELAVLDLVEEMGEDLRQALGIRAISEEEQAALRAVVPAGPEAVRLYAEGLDLLRRYEALQALERFRRAEELDPNNARIHSAMASAWLSLGYWPEARAAAAKAYEESKVLSHQDRLWVEAQYFEISNKRQQAMENYARLWQAFPDNLEYGLQLAKSEISMGKPDQAVETVLQLRRLPAPSGEDPRLDLVEADAARALSVYPEQQRKAAAAAAKAEVLADRLLVARAREVEAAAWRDLGEPTKARQAYEEALDLYGASNNRSLVARVLVALAKLDRHLGNLEAAKETLRRASKVAQEIGDQGSLKHGLNTLAIILRQQGDLRQAQEMHRQELVANREIGDFRGEQITLTSLGVVERELGDLTAAESHFEQALALGREISSRRSVAINLNLLGEVRLRRGDVTGAQNLFEQALAANQGLGNRRGEAYYYSSLAEVAWARDDAATARRLHDSALAIRRDIGEQTNIAVSEMALAAIDLELGSADSAVSLARSAAQEFAREGKPQDEAKALALLARGELQRGGAATAAEAAGRAVERVVGVQNRGTQLRVWIDTAGVLAATGERAMGIEQLRRAAQQSEALGFVDLRLEAALELSRLLAQDDVAAAESLRQQVAKEAKEHGFLRLARQASDG